MIKRILKRADLFCSGQHANMSNFPFKLSTDIWGIKVKLEVAKIGLLGNYPVRYLKASILMPDNQI